MTPKEKAQELTNDYKRLFWQISLEQLKICALITVDEILDAIIGTYDFDSLNYYWEEVKKEIKNL